MALKITKQPTDFLERVAIEASLLPDRVRTEADYSEKSEEVDVVPEGESLEWQGRMPTKSQSIIDSTSHLSLGSEVDGANRKTRLRAAPTAWIHNLLHLNGDKFDFTGREYLIPLYNNNLNWILLKTARQVEKSSYLGNDIVIKSCINPYYKTLYVSPSHAQTRQFSNEKLKPLLEQSPIIAKYFQDSFVSSQVFEKGFTNGSMCFLRSAFLTADRCRGISADDLKIDEIQDMLMSNVPVIEECLSHSKYKRKTYAGTPKTFENTIEIFWGYTSQNEWLVPCDCGLTTSASSTKPSRYWNFLDKDNIDIKRGVVCKKCRRRLDIPSGRWVTHNKKNIGHGFRIPQLMVPWIINTERDWQVLVNKFKTYPEAQFANEVLGLSYDSANKPIARSDLIQCCNSGRRPWVSPFDNEAYVLSRKIPLSMGIDWGEGVDGGITPSGKIRNASYTVVTIGCRIGSRYCLMWAKKYEGKEADPDFIVKDVVKYALHLNIPIVGVDWGHGWGVNNQIVRSLGAERVIQFQHIGNMKERRVYDPDAFRYKLNRNLIMSELFLLMKGQGIEFFQWEYFEPFAMDILAIYAEYCEYQRTLKYDHKPSDPDDFFHSLLYGWQASNIYHGLLD